MNRMYLGFDFETAQIRKIRSNDDFCIRRSTLVILSICFRWGNEKAYGYVGAGIGGEYVNSRSRGDHFELGESLLCCSRARSLDQESKILECHATEAMHRKCRA